LRLGSGPLVAAAWGIALRRAGHVARIDLIRTTGLRYAWRRRRQLRRWESLQPRPRSAVYREIWREAAADVGADVVDLTEERLELRRDGVSTRVLHQSVALGDAGAVQLADDKPLVHRLLVEAGLPVPEHLEFAAGDLSVADAFLAARPGPCVVKPASGTGAGWGVTPSVWRRSQLRRAALSAARYGPRLLIERQVDGSHFRLLLLDGALLGAVRRGPPTVVGDGRSTIGELVAAENERRIAARGEGGLWLLRVDLDCLFTLERAGLRLSSVVAAGERVAVKTATGENAPADNETVTHPVSPAVLADGARAAEVLGLRLVGLDVIAPGPDLAGATIIEVNGSPGLTYHRHVADRATAIPVAVPLLERLLAEAAASRPGPSPQEQERERRLG
jgi:D-alanine-D-alanine ligase-like ATP-grasp enzyme